MIIRVALFGVVFAIVVGATIFLADRLINHDEMANETVTSRFPEDGAAAPVVEYKKLHWPSVMPRMSADEFIAAVTAVERRPPQGPPQPVAAVFNDAQIASMRTLPYLSAAVAALGLLLIAPGAQAITNTALA